MRLLLPAVSGLFLSAGICCCGDFIEGFKQSIEEGMAAQDASGDATVEVDVGSGGGISVGGGDVPSGIAEIYVPKGAKLTTGASMAGLQSAIWEMKGGNAVEVVQGFKKGCEKKGWEVTNHVEAGDTAICSCAGDGKTLDVTASDQAGTLMITASLQ